MSTPMNLIWLALAQKTAQIIAENQEALGQAKWKDGESNTDSDFSKIACRCCMEAWDSVKGSFPDLSHLSLTANSPDVTITLWNGEEKLKKNKVVAKGKIELKSGKGDSIPGSTILSLDVNQPVIYCKRDEENKVFNIRYGQYHMCMVETDLDRFQDRAPRSPVSYLKMTDVDIPVVYTEKEKGDWVRRYAVCAVNRMALRSSEKEKKSSWQDPMVNCIIDEYLRRTSIEEITRRKSGL
jgi:hypothetical protein